MDSATAYSLKKRMSSINADADSLLLKAITICIGKGKKDRFLGNSLLISNVSHNHPGIFSLITPYVSACMLFAVSGKRAGEESMHKLFESLSFRYNAQMLRFVLLSDLQSWIEYSHLFSFLNSMGSKPSPRALAETASSLGFSYEIKIAEQIAMAHKGEQSVLKHCMGDNKRIMRILSPLISGISSLDSYLFSIELEALPDNIDAGLLMRLPPYRLLAAAKPVDTLGGLHNYPSELINILAEPPYLSGYYKRYWKACASAIYLITSMANIPTSGEIIKATRSVGIDHDESAAAYALGAYLNTAMVS